MISPLDNYLLRAYLDGEMDAATTQAFEIRLIERPELAEFVDADSALGIGLRAADAPAAAPAATVVALPQAAPARRVARAVPFLAAAAILLAAGIGAGRLLRPGTAALVPATVVYVDKFRSAEAAAMKLPVPASGSVVLMVPAATSPSCMLRVQVKQGSVMLAADTKADALDYANLVADASRLSPGAAVIAVGCIGDKPNEYAVEFVRQ